MMEEEIPPFDAASYFWSSMQQKEVGS